MNLKIYATTDIHGSIFPTNYSTKDQFSDIGIAKIASLIKANRNEDTILIDNGDSFQGSPLMTYALENLDYNPMAKVFNMMSYDYYNLGNHDFNYGEEALLQFIDENKAKLLTSNVFYKDKTIGESVILEKDGKRVALIGVLTHYIPNWEKPQNIVNFTFKDAYTHLVDEVNRLKDKTDIIIAVYHGGLEKDPQTAVPTETLTGENQGYEMSQIEDLDLLITGHQHRSLVENLFGTVVTQSTFKGAEFVEIDLNDEEITTKLHTLEGVKEDEEIINTFQDLQDKTQAWLDIPIGTIKDNDLIVHDPRDARLHKHPVISFLNQVQLDRSGADIAGIALFNDEAKGFNQSITIRDIVSTYPYPNTMVIKEMSGKLLVEMLEWSAKYFTLDQNNNIIVDPKYVLPKPEHYNYDMFDGIDYTINVSNPVGSRIENLMFKGKSVKDEDTFKVVMNNYRASGGGDYGMILEAETVQEIQEEMIDTLINYLKNHSPVVVDHKNNITVTHN